MPTYIAIDLGAESGRVIAGTLDGGRVQLEELHRFPNAPARLTDGLHWDAPRLYYEALIGLRIAGQRYGQDLAGIGVDAWAVDYGLLDAAGRLLGNPYHYRDGRTDGVREAVARVVPAATQYARTGIAQLPFNTLYQLVAQRVGGDPTLDVSQALLMMPDLLHYWLTGERATEYTNATSTGMLGVDGAWTTDLLARLNVPAHMLLMPSQSGVTLGPVREAVRAECGIEAVPVILPATHDTACAVVAVPAVTPARTAVNHAYISSGTWSLLGLELDRPILTEEARLAGFTNEGGVGGTYRFLTNIMGLWLLQECRRAWARGGREWSYDELTARAATIPAPGVALDVDDPDFLRPADMPTMIQAQLARTGQPAVDDPIVLARVIVEGLALKYRVALARAEHLAGARVETIHIVGGGARNTLLCQLTADACERPVAAGPIEATAWGNVLTQAMGRGQVRDMAEARAIVRASTGIRHYEPRDRAYWDDLHGRPRRHGDSAPR